MKAAEKGKLPINAPDIDAISLKMINEKTMDYLRKKDGKELFGGQAFVADNETTMTDIADGTRASGQAITYSLFLEKQDSSIRRRIVWRYPRG